MTCREVLRQEVQPLLHLREVLRETLDLGLEMLESLFNDGCGEGVDWVDHEGQVVEDQMAEVGYELLCFLKALLNALWKPILFDGGLQKQIFEEGRRHIVVAVDLVDFVGERLENVSLRLDHLLDREAIQSCFLRERPHEDGLDILELGAGQNNGHSEKVKVLLPYFLVLPPLGLKICIKDVNSCKHRLVGTLSESPEDLNHPVKESLAVDLRYLVKLEDLSRYLVTRSPLKILEVFKLELFDGYLLQPLSHSKLGTAP